MQNLIREKMVENGVPAEVQARTKRIYSIYQKIQRQQRPVEQIYDLLAVRVVTDTVKNCYAALGVIHQLWRPVPGRFKDYIAMPRPNLYQSLHTTVINAGQSFEVQIRTQEMHRIAEEGVAAHWKYKDGREISGADDQRIVWMRQLIEWVREMAEPSEFLSTLRVDLYPEEVYTFTPKGLVVVLPRGATAVDFAYAIHTEVGNQCVGAKVNGQIVPLRHAVGNGDVIEILTQKGHTPSRDWLTFVRTSRARSKIRQWINLHERREATEVGRRLLEKEARQCGLNLKKIREEELTRVANEYGCARTEDLYAELGLRQMVRAPGARQRPPGKDLVEKPEEKSPKLVSTVKRMLGIQDGTIMVRGHDDLMVFRSKCCNAIPGDDIVGYVTRGRGVAVHSTSCPNVQNLLYEAERRIAVEWASSSAATFPVRLRILTEDRPGLLADITAVISEAQANIRNLESSGVDLHARIELALDVTTANNSSAFSPTSSAFPASSKSSVSTTSEVGTFTRPFAVLPGSGFRPVPCSAIRDLSSGFRGRIRAYNVNVMISLSGKALPAAALVLSAWPCARLPESSSHGFQALSMASGSATRSKKNCAPSMYRCRGGGIGEGQERRNHGRYMRRVDSHRPWKAAALCRWRRCLRPAPGRRVRGNHSGIGATEPIGIAIRRRTSHAPRRTFRFDHSGSCAPPRGREARAFRFLLGNSPERGGLRIHHDGAAPPGNFRQSNRGHRRAQAPWRQRFERSLPLFRLLTWF